MTGKLLGLVILIAAVAGGAALYYLQVYHFYETVEPAGSDDVRLVAQDSDTPEAIDYAEFQAIDAMSSPIRYRACFDTTLGIDAARAEYRVYDGAVPLEAPGWFDCFDAGAIGAALEDGRATAFLGEENISYGIDRVVALTAAGRGFVWHQINRCGKVVFDGKPAPAGCPEPPEGY